MAFLRKSDLFEAPIHIPWKDITTSSCSTVSMRPSTASQPKFIMATSTTCTLHPLVAGTRAFDSSGICHTESEVEPRACSGDPRTNWRASCERISCICTARGQAYLHKCLFVLGSRRLLPRSYQAHESWSRQRTRLVLIPVFSSWTGRDIYEAIQLAS